MTSNSRTVLQALLNSFEKATVHNSNVTVAPASLLWPDEQRQWEPLLPLLRETCPYLLTLGEYNPAKRMGPAIWIKCMLGRQLEASTWAAEAVPIIYLPGVGRVILRAVESSPKHLQPLAELQYSGVFWSQVNGRDWTLLAFLKSREGGLGLDIALDARNLEAMGRALLQLADTAMDKLQGRRLEAEDFTPHVASTGKPLTAHHFQKLLGEKGIQALDRDATGEPSGIAWCEHGDLDQTGHEQGWKLARRVDDELRELSDRIESLLTAGWKKVQVLTDHGWLLMPGGPRSNL